MQKKNIKWTIKLQEITGKWKKRQGIITKLDAAIKAAERERDHEDIKGMEND